MDVRTEIGPCWPRRRETAAVRPSLCLPRLNRAEIFKKTLCISGLHRSGRDVAQDMLEVVSIPMLSLSPAHHLLLCARAVAGRGDMQNSKVVMPKPRQDSAVAVGARIFNVKLTDKESIARPSGSMRRATNHASGTMWKYARRAKVATGAAEVGFRRGHEKQYYADI